MARTARLPGRCVTCNQAAVKSIARKLYWSSGLWWTIFIATPLVIFILGMYGGMFWLLDYFWPAIVALVVLNFFVRRTLKVDFGICARHQRMRRIFFVASTAALCTMGLGLVAGNFNLSVLALGGGGFLALVLGVVQSYSGVQAIRLARLTPERAWLKGVGNAFRDSFPEMPG